MNTRQRYMLFILVICLLTWSGLAQEASSCPAIVLDAMVAVGSLCEEIGRNQACYGNNMLVVEAQEGIEKLVFDMPGDIANVADIQSVRLTGMDETVPEWGVVLMNLQANLPNTLPGQNVVMLMFGDIDLRNATDAKLESYAPMQAFYFRSGIGHSLCTEAPESGVLIQTPEGLGQIALRVNNVDISLGSTAFLQAVASDALYVNLLEGQATVTAFDGIEIVSAGMMVSVPIDEHLAASGPPSSPEPYIKEHVEGVYNMLAMGNTSLDTIVEQINVMETGELTPSVEPTHETTAVEELPESNSEQHGETLTFDASACPYEPGRVYELEANRAYTVRTWPGCWLTTSDAQASKAEVTISVTINGIPAGTFAGFGPLGACAPSDGGYNFLAKYRIEPLSPGSHTIQVVHNHPGGRAYSPSESSDAWIWTETCTVHVK